MNRRIVLIHFSYSREYNLSLNKAIYRGMYSHPLVGDIVVSSETDIHQELSASWGNLKSKVYLLNSVDEVTVERLLNKLENMEFQTGKSKVLSKTQKLYF